MTLHPRHRLPGGPCPKMTTDYCIVIQDQGLYQFSEFFIVKKCLKSSAQDLITDKQTNIQANRQTYRQTDVKANLRKCQLQTIISQTIFVILKIVF
ncbi:hypothetical protein QTP88_022250 [Uroleucon formosanum]